MANRLDDLTLGGAVHLGDEIIAPFGCDLEAFQAVETADNDFAGPPGGFDGYVEKWLLHGSERSRWVR